MNEIKNVKSTIWFLKDDFVDTISTKERPLFIVKKLEELRLKEGISQKALTQKLGIGEKTINHWKSGVKISNKTISEIMKVYPELEQALIELYTDNPYNNIASDHLLEFKRNTTIDYHQARTISTDILIPQIIPGQTMYFNKIENFKVLPWGNIFLVNTPDFEVIRIVTQGPDDTYILTSPNPQYQPIHLKRADIKSIYIHHTTITEYTL